MSGRAASSFAWVALVIGVAVCLVAAYAAYSLANYSWAQVVEYKSPYVSAQIPAALRSVEPTPGPQVVRRVVLVIVDGMREDVSRSDMPSLNALRQYGSDITLTVPQPSLSYPNWTTILTGASQTISGVTTNWYSGRVLAPTIVDVAKNAGRRVMVAGPTDFEGLYGIEPGPDASLRPWPKGGYLSATLVDDVLRMSKETTADLVVLHLPDLDEAGHSYGGASAQYRDVAKRIDGDIARLVETLQGDETAFVVVADHGHIDSGGHGGWEPSVLQVPGVFAGGGIRLRAGTGSLDQIAPTVAVMLGVPTPAYADSVALRDVLSTAQPDAYASDASVWRAT